MKTHAFLQLFSISFSLILIMTSCKPAENEELTIGTRPNIIHIYLDDLDNTMLGCYGGTVKTPNIDSLAAHGILFTRYYPSSPVCTPSRYTALTGKFASRSTSDTFLKDSPIPGQAFVRWNTDISESDVTIPEVLKEHGYRTGMAGKWHLGFPNYDPMAIPYDADPVSPEVSSFLRDNYEETAAYVKQIAGFDEVHSFYSINMRWIPVPEKLDRHNQEWIDRGALQFIENNHATSFYLYYATTLPHTPPAYESLISKPATPLGFDTLSNAERKFREELLAEVSGMSPAEREKYVAARWIDHGIGKLVRKVKELGIDDNTVFIIASDNDSRSKMACYDGRVPLIISGGAVPSQKMECDELVSNADFAPTIYDLCDVNPNETVQLDGLSLLPLISGEVVEWRESVYLEVLYTRGVITRDWNYVAIRYPDSIMQSITYQNRQEFSQEGTRESVNDGITTGEKVRYGTDISFPAYYDFDQLYNLQKDPMQQVNLAYDPEHEIKLLEMKKILNEYSETLPHDFGEFK